ncbi:MAG: glycogen/starch synthase [Bacteroidales bacterium]
MEATKVLFISQELVPYLPESEIATICRQLPQGIQDRGKEIRTFMPKFGCINERRNQLHEVIRLSGMNMIIDDTDHPLIIKVASIQSARMQVYFIDNDDYFQRKGMVADENGVEYDDNDERAIFFARGVLETVKKLRWTPDIIHCHGWITALAPLYIKKLYSEDPFFRNSKIVFSLYDNDFKGKFRKGFSEMLRFDGISDEDVSTIAGKELDFTELSQFAINYSDGVIQGSENVNEAVKTYAQATGLPYLDHQQPDQYIDAYNEFYDIVWANANK